MKTCEAIKKTDIVRLGFKVQLYISCTLNPNLISAQISAQIEGDRKEFHKRLS